MQPMSKWHWDTQRVVEVLATRNAMSAMRGKACPVAAKVLERLESTYTSKGA
jgi:hypothetical protein